MQKFYANPFTAARTLWRNRELIMISTKREILGRYRGSLLGSLWAVFHPIIMLSIYTLVFSVIFQARWAEGGESKMEFALILFLGLIVFNIFSDYISRVSHIILANPNYVKKVIFPLEILPLVNLLGVAYHGLVSFLMWLVVHIFVVGLPPYTLFYLPFVLVPFLLLLIGVGWLLSSISVYFRDVPQLTGVIITVSMFLSPIFYSINMVPEEYRWLVYLNPITPAIEMIRALAYWGKLPNLIMLSAYWGAACLVMWGGLISFQKLRKGFADVL